MTMKKKPNLDEFLEAGAGDKADKQAVNDEVQVPGKVHKEQKVVRLPLDLINALKRESFERSMKTGLRVTETELVEQALREFIKN